MPDSPTSLLDRVALATGAGFVACILVGNSLTESGAPTEQTPAAATEYFTLLNAGSHRVGLGLELFGFCLLLVFLARLWAVLRAAERGSGWLSGLAIAGGLTTIGVKLATASPALVGLTVPDLPGEQAQLLLRLGEAGFLVSAMTYGVFLLGVAGAGLATGILPRWLSVLGTVFGSLAVLGSLAPSSLEGTPGVLGFLLGLFWTAIVSVLLAVRNGSAAPVAGREAAHAAA